MNPTSSACAPLSGLAFEHQIERRPYAEEPHGAHRAAEARMNAEQDLGQSQGELRVVGADPIAAGEGEFQAAAEGEPVDGSNARAGETLELIEHRLSGAHQAIAVLRRRAP